jgi:hypothetical protein
MRQVTRKAAVTVGLGAALVAAAAGGASAAGTGNSGLLNPQLPELPGTVADQQTGLGQTFPVGLPTDRLPTGEATAAVQNTTGNTLPQVQQALPHLDMPSVPGLGV